MKLHILYKTSTADAPVQIDSSSTCQVQASAADLKGKVEDKPYGPSNTLAKNEGDSDKEPVVQTLLAWMKRFGSSLG